MKIKSAGAYKPRRVLKEHSEFIANLLMQIAIDSGNVEYRQIANIVKIYVTAAKIPRAILHKGMMTITIPITCCDFIANPDKWLHYTVAHEFSHCIMWMRTNGEWHDHGLEFQNILKTLTPYSYYELQYKPTYAMKAGIKSENYFREIADILQSVGNR